MSNAWLINQSPRPGERRAVVTSSVALTKGYAVCYTEDTTIGDTDNAYTNANTIAKPTAANAGAFAGVLVDSYSAETGGRTVEIAEPGAVCMIYVDGAYSQGDYVSFIIDEVTAADNGQFGRFNGLYGRGTARLLEASTEAGLVKAVLLDGKETYGTHKIQPAAGAITTTPEGLTYMPGGNTIAANATYTLPATRVGMEKTFFLSAATVTSDVVVTLATSGFNYLSGGAKLDGFNTITITDAGDFTSLKSVGHSADISFQLVLNEGSTLSTV
jgi:hypothetical protein